MATHSSILACRIPWTEKPSGLQSMGSLSFIFKVWQPSQISSARSNPSNTVLSRVHMHHTFDQHRCFTVNPKCLASPCP